MRQEPCTVIQKLYSGFHKGERAIADYILKDPIHIMDISVQRMAREVGVAESSIVRFCKTIGCAGFRELKLLLAGSESSRLPPTIFEELSAEDNMHSITQKVFSQNIDTLQRAQQAIDFDKVEDAVQLLRQAKRIYIYGVGASASIADDFYVRLMRIDMCAIAVTDSHLSQISAGLLRKGDVAIGISHTGRTFEIVQALEVARKSGAKTIGITGHARMPIEKVCDICIDLYSPTKLFISPRVAQISLIDSLYVGLAIQNELHVMKCVERMEEVLTPLRIKGSYGISKFKDK